MLINKNQKIKIEYFYNGYYIFLEKSVEKLENLVQNWNNFKGSSSMLRHIGNKKSTHLYIFLTLFVV